MTYRLLILWLLGYAFTWTVTTVLVDPSVPYDAIEALNWGQNMEWGSPKNPWLVGMVFWPALWFPALSLNVYWYATHFLAIAIGMAGCWFLARRLSASEPLAWLALLTLNLSGLINFDIISYNDNYLLVMLWPWMMLFFVQAISRRRRWWLAFAVAAGLATMAKYSTLALVGGVFLSTLLVPSVRRCYNHPVFYLALLIYFILVTPNIIWLWQHDFAAFRWVDSQIDAGLNLSLFTALLTIFYPLFFLWWILRLSGCRPGWPGEMQQRILLGVYWLPLIIICGWFLFHRGGRLTEWLQPFFILAPAIMVSCTQEKRQQMPRIACFSLGLFALLVLGGYTAVMVTNIANAGEKWSGIIPFSQQADKAWRERYGTPLAFVGGANLAQWLTFYAPSRPHIITRWDNATQPNIYNAHLQREELKRKGVLLIGEYAQKCTANTFHQVLQPWPELHIDTMREVMFQGDRAHNARLVCLGFIAPQAY